MSKGSELVNHLLNENPDNITLDPIMSMALTATFDRQLDRGLGIDPIFAFLAILTADRNATVTLNEIQDDQITNPGIYEPDPPPGTRIEVEIDTTAFPTQADFDAGGEAYNFIDDAAVSNYAVIANFSADDTISFVNAVVDDYTFSNEGEDVTLSYNYNDDGIMNVIKLTGVVSSDAMVYDLASFTEAVGFDAFG